MAGGLDIVRQQKRQQQARADEVRAKAQQSDADRTLAERAAGMGKPSDARRSDRFPPPPVFAKPHPADNKMAREPVANKDGLDEVPFATMKGSPFSAARDLARKDGLTRSDFEGKEYTGDAGFTASDVRDILHGVERE